jgi:hypothetical protein
VPFLGLESQSEINILSQDLETLLMFNVDTLAKASYNICSQNVAEIVR